MKGLRRWVVFATIPFTALTLAAASALPPDAASPEAQAIPAFSHVIIVIFENKEFGDVMGNRGMPNFNRWAGEYALLTRYCAVSHPSLPNYLALIGGDLFGVQNDCTGCFVNSRSLPDLLEASGRTWKAYQEDMPSPCFGGAESGKYAMKHNPFVYFEPIRLDEARCRRSVVPMTELYADLAGGTLPNYAFITPNLCNDAHDCGIGTADSWLKKLMLILLPLLDRDGKPYLVILTWDEGQGDSSCCGLPKEAGGRIATILVSPQAKSGFEDATPYTTYSILKTIEEAWHLPHLVHSADEENALITAPWKK